METLWQLGGEPLSFQTHLFQVGWQSGAYRMLSGCGQHWKVFVLRMNQFIHPNVLSQHQLWTCRFTWTCWYIIYIYIIIHIYHIYIYHHTYIYIYIIYIYISHIYIIYIYISCVYIYHIYIYIYHIYISHIYIYHIYVYIYDRDFRAFICSGKLWMFTKLWAPDQKIVCRVQHHVRQDLDKWHVRMFFGKMDAIYSHIQMKKLWYQNIIGCYNLDSSWFI